MKHPETTPPPIPTNFATAPPPITNSADVGAAVLLVDGSQSDARPGSVTTYFVASCLKLAEIDAAIELSGLARQIGRPAAALGEKREVKGLVKEMTTTRAAYLKASRSKIGMTQEKVWLQNTPMCQRRALAVEARRLARR